MQPQFLTFDVFANQLPVHFLWLKWSLFRALFPESFLESLSFFSLSDINPLQAPGSSSFYHSLARPKITFHDLCFRLSRRTRGRIFTCICCSLLKIALFFFIFWPVTQIIIQLANSICLSFFFSFRDQMEILEHPVHVGQRYKNIKDNF